MLFTVLLNAIVEPLLVNWTGRQIVDNNGMNGKVDRYNYITDLSFDKVISTDCMIQSKLRVFATPLL